MVCKPPPQTNPLSSLNFASLRKVGNEARHTVVRETLLRSVLLLQAAADVHSLVAVLGGQFGKSRVNLAAHPNVLVFEQANQLHHEAHAVLVGNVVTARSQRQTVVATKAPISIGGLLRAHHVRGIDKSEGVGSVVPIDVPIGRIHFVQSLIFVAIGW